MNKQKTKTMKIGSERETFNIFINEEKVEQANCFKYLGDNYIEDRGNFEEIKGMQHSEN